MWFSIFMPVIVTLTTVVETRLTLIQKLKLTKVLFPDISKRFFLLTLSFIFVRTAQTLKKC